MLTKISKAIWNKLLMSVEDQENQRQLSEAFVNPGNSCSFKEMGYHEKEVVLLKLMCFLLVPRL